MTEPACDICGRETDSVEETASGELCIVCRHDPDGRAGENGGEGA
jgi:hypothetical protein